MQTHTRIRACIQKHSIRARTRMHARACTHAQTHTHARTQTHSHTHARTHTKTSSHAYTRTHTLGIHNVFFNFFLTIHSMEFVTQILTYCRGKEMAWHGCHIFSSSQCCSASLLQSTNAFWPIIKNTICCQVEPLLFLPEPSTTCSVPEIPSLLCCSVFL